METTAHVALTVMLIQKYVPAKQPMDFSSVPGSPWIRTMYTVLTVTATVATSVETHTVFHCEWDWCLPRVLATWSLVSAICTARAAVHILAEQRPMMNRDDLGKLDG